MTNTMDYSAGYQDIHLKRTKSSFESFSEKPERKITMQPNYLKTVSSTANFFTRTASKSNLREVTRHSRGNMIRAQSMRVPPGFEPIRVESKGILEEEEEFDQSLFELNMNEKPRDKQLKRFVTFANLHKKSSFRAVSEFSDDEDVDVDIIEDEALMDITCDRTNHYDSGLFENVDVGSSVSASTNSSHILRRKRSTQRLNPHTHQQTHGYSSSPSHEYHDKQQYSNSGYSTQPQAYSQIPPMTNQHQQQQSYYNDQSATTQPQQYNSYVHQQPYSPMNQSLPLPGSGTGMNMNMGLGLGHQDEYLAQNRILMELVMKQNMMLQQQQMNTRFRPTQPIQQTTSYESSSSSLLSRHKTTGYRPTLNELRSHIMEFGRDSHGSRYIQSLMEHATANEREQIIDEVIPEAVGLMQDLFGNYVIQNFLEYCTKAQRTIVATKIKQNMNLLSFQPHGCRVVQRAIDKFNSDERNSLLEEVIFPGDKILRCAKDPHATHVLQKAVVLVQRELKNPDTKASTNEMNMNILKSIEQAVENDILNLCTHPHACRLVQKVLGDCNYNRSSHVAKMIELIRTKYPSLATDQHGNFIMQHIIDNGTEQHKAQVQAYVCTRFLELSQHKFGSHLVEKCLNSSSKTEAKSLVTELLKPALELRKKRGNNIVFSDKDTSDVLLALMKDPYANFVVQRAFDASDGSLRQQLTKEIRDRGDILSRFTYGRHILSHVNRN